MFLIQSIQQANKPKDAVVADVDAERSRSNDVAALEVEGKKEKYVSVLLSDNAWHNNEQKDFSQDRNALFSFFEGEE